MKNYNPFPHRSLGKVRGVSGRLRGVSGRLRGVSGVGKYVGVAEQPEPGMKVERLCFSGYG